MSLFRSASLISGFTLLSRITGLVREQLIAMLFGASAMTDAFNVAFRIPNLLRRLFAEGAFTQAFVPVLAHSKEQDGQVATQHLINAVATVLSTILFITCLVGVLSAPLLVWLMASGLQQNPQGFHAATVMTRIMFPYIGFMSLVAFSAGILNTYKNFAIPAFTPVMLNICVIAAAWWGVPWFTSLGIEPIYAIAVGVMAGGLGQLLLQWPALKRAGLMPHMMRGYKGLRAAWSYPGTRRIFSLMLPAVLGVGVAQISLLINTQIASHLQTGSVSWLSYADRLMEFPTAMLGVALGVVLLPHLAKAKASDDMQRYSDTLDWGLRLVVVLATPAALALVLFAQPLVAVMYQYRAFSSLDVLQTASALQGYGMGLVGLVSIKILAPGYYARQDIKTPVKIALLVLVVTQLLNLILVPNLAQAGLALSIGLGAVFNAVLLLAGLLRKGVFRPQQGWGALLMRVLVASVILAIFLIWANFELQWLQNIDKGWRVLQLMACIAAAILLYFTALIVSGLNLRKLIYFD